MSEDLKQFARPIGEHVSLGRTLRGVIFVVPIAVIALIFYPFDIYSLEINGVVSRPLGIIIVAAFLWFVVVSGLRVAAQWERGVVLRLGKFQTIRGPGLLYIIPVLENVRFLDTRVLVLNIPRQKVITKDNVPAEIDAALFFMVEDSEKAVITIQDFKFAVAQYAQAALRDIIGGLTLDELLSEREQIQIRLKEHVEERVKEWGLRVDSLRLQDIELPEDLKRMMSRQASAEREKRATITKAEGDKLAATNLAEAAKIMSDSPITLQLRTLQTIDGLGSSPSNTVILFPAQIGELLRHLANKSAKE
ncbi:slipin family protein [Candidatus Contendibacter odensensis]|uniref:Band 7 protein n=1 Tax=Candidatus Contendobacter odensis Run_B_J11 TaxID=1400861 RepID=A0A7U7GC89_9GAMM|nr:slipin family protein [Candidatus Contendobacter odensis]CDH45492.1 Band 7 protein [Candidatus Contendobacter odensis Run_B_J11]